MSFKKDFNDLLNKILVNYRNLGPVEQIDVQRLKAEQPAIYAQYVTQAQPDVSKGSILFIRAACTAAMEYGVYSTLDRVSDQMFMETAERTFKEKHATEYGISTTGKTDAQLIEAVLAKKRNKLAGGNKYDYQFWAKEVVSELSNFNPNASSVSHSGLGNFNAANTVDGLTEVKAWDSDESIEGAFVRLNISATPRAYNALRLFTSAGGSSAVYNIQYSDDSVVWVSAAQLEPVLNGWNQVSWESVGPHKYWRLRLSNTPGVGPFITEMSWLEGPENVRHVEVYPLAQGEGTFDIIIQGSLELGLPSKDLLEKVAIHINERRPVGAGFSWGMRVLSPLALMQDVQISGFGAAWNKEAAKASIQSYMLSLLAGQPLYRSQLFAIAHQHGAESVTVVQPVEDVIPMVATAQGIYEVVRPGIITI